MAKSRLSATVKKKKEELCYTKRKRGKRILEKYKTIKENGVHEIEIKGSRFIAHFSRVKDEEEALEFIQAIKKEHWKATHNCSAFLIGENDQVKRAMDDGEPSGTAGIPMLEVLKKNELKDIAVEIGRAHV